MESIQLCKVSHTPIECMYDLHTAAYSAPSYN